MVLSQTYKMHTMNGLCAALIISACLATHAYAQQEKPTPPPPVAPPPMKFIKPDERAQLNEAREEKKRMRLTLDFCESHLHRAEELTNAAEFDAAAAQLGSYQALLEDIMHYLSGQYADRSRLRDLFKRVELALRAHAPRIEAIRRVTPAEYAVRIKEIAEFVRDTRTEALDSFYGNTVMREAPPNSNKDADHKQPQTTSNGPPNKQP